MPSYYLRDVRLDGDPADVAVVTLSVPEEGEAESLAGVIVTRETQTPRISELFLGRRPILLEGITEDRSKISAEVLIRRHCTDSSGVSTFELVGLEKGESG